jgi:putative DNA-invertase from lambdoid prophage Rac
MKKIALYSRVSTADQTTENQVIRLKEYAVSKGLEFDLYTEVMSSRKTRPVKAELLKKLRNGDYDSVVVFRLDRWARSSTELILETKELIDKGVNFISLSDNLDFSTASGKLHFQILSSFAEWEREILRERTLEGLRRAKMQGKTLGRPPGAKDKKKRKKSGYLLRMAGERQKDDQDKGIYKSIDDYIS